MRTDDGSEGCDWTAEDEALADSAHETQKHIERVNRHRCLGCGDVVAEGHRCERCRRVGAA